MRHSPGLFILAQWVQDNGYTVLIVCAIFSVFLCIDISALAIIEHNDSVAQKIENTLQFLNGARHAMSKPTTGINPERHIEHAINVGTVANSILD